MLKKFTLTALLFAILCTGSIAQSITNYSFSSVASGTFSTLSSPTTATLTAGTADEGYYNAIPIGFNFWYMGTRYTTVSASTNGWLSFGADITNASPANNLATGGTPRPLIAPLWDDLALTATSNVSYLTTGTAPNRVFTVQYLNVKWGNTASAAVVSFQVKLTETTGKIDFIYRPEAGTLTSASASVGIAATATGSGSYLSLNGSGAISSISETNSLATKPATGQSFSFTPPVPNAPTALTFTSVTATGMTLNWTDNASNERGFIIYRSTDNVNFTYMSQVGASVTTSAQAGLSYNTTYYWKVQAISEGGASSALSGNQVTPCVTPAAPVVVSPVNYCLNATASPLTATGTNLLWGGGSGSVGGTANLATTTYIDNSYNNKKTNFTTTIDNVTITSVDYFIPGYQAVSGLVLSIYNSAGTVIATSTTNTSTSATAAGLKVTNVFNYTIPTAGNYSIGVSSGMGNIGADNPTFPVTEASGTINVTGTTPAGVRMFNNIQFNASSAIAPTPSTATAGSKSYYVTQTVNGCLSPAATIVVNVNSVSTSQIPATGQIINLPFTGNANDVSGNLNNGVLQNAPAAVADRFGNASKAYSFNGSTQYISTTKSYVNPNTFTISIWFKTATAGGRLIGFGREQTGQSGQYDRHIYMNNSGQLYFGVYPNQVVTVNSSASYNDDKWHQAVATLGAAGMALYVDGALVGSNTSTTSAENYTGWWRIAYDNNNSWTSQPGNFYFTGVLDDALIYDRALTASEVTSIYNSPEGAGNNGPVCAGSTLTFSGATISGATYAWSGPNGFTSTQQNPTLTFSAAAAGTYTLVATVNGCSATSYTNVTATTTAGQWTGNTSTDWADGSNWCTGTVPTSATNVIITATATRQPTISSAVVCNNLTINAGAIVTTAAAGTLSISGLLTNNGTMANNGTTAFVGTSGQQTFTGVTAFNNITVNNTSGILLPAAITANNVILTAGILNANNFNIDVKGNWLNNASATALTAGTASVTFTGTTAQTIGGTFETSFNSVTASNVGSTITLTNNIKVAGNLVVGGVFDLVGFTANRTAAGGTLYINNTGYLKIGGTNTLPSNYSTNTFLTASTVEYSGTNQTVSAQSYGNLVFSSSAGAAVKSSAVTTFSTQGNFTMNKGAGTSVSFSPSANLSIGGNVSIGTATTWNGGSYTHTIGGNWVNNGTYNGNTGTVVFAGANKTVSGPAASQNFNSITITASGVVFFDDGGLTMSGNLLTSGSGSFTQLAGGILTMTGSAATITGNSISIENLTVTGSGKVTANNSLTFTGNLSMVNAGNTFTGAAGTTIILSGAAKTISGAGSAAFQVLNITGSNIASTNFSIASALVVDGTFSATAGTATFTGSASLSGRADLFTVVENGTKLQLSGNAILGIANTLSFTAGTLDVTTSVPNTVNFNGAAQTINPITYNNLLLSNGNTKTAASGLTVNNNLTIAASTTFAGGSYTHNIFNDWINNGTYAAGTSVVRFAGSSSSNIGGSSVTTFNELTADKSTFTTVLLLQNDVNTAIVNMTKGRMNTSAARTITITNTRNGAGIIIGNIKRTHSFTTGVDYAFEGPNNTINFSAVSGVTSVTVSVALGSVSDFPSGASINRLYTIAIPAGTYTSKLRLHYEDDELNGNIESSMALWSNPASSWAPVGASTGNDAANNYVEKSGLSGIVGRWTLSQTPSNFIWSGVIDNHWDKPGNWKYGGVAATFIPTPTDIVDLGTETFTNHPTISTAVTVKNINFGSVKAVQLSMASGGSLVTGNMSGLWSANASHQINANAQNITINGSLALSDGTAGHNIDLSISTGTVTVTGALAQSGNAAVTFTGNGKLQIGSHYTYTNGTFTGGTGTVEFNGTTNQVVAPVSYYNLTVNKSNGTAMMSRSNTINGDLLVNNGLVTNDSTCNIRGNVTIGAAGTLENNYILRVGGNWLNNGTYNGQGVNVVFDGTGSQTISSTTFNNIEFNKPVGTVAELTGAVTIKGNLVGTSGTLDTKSFFFNRDAIGGSATLYDNGTLIIAADNAPTKFSNYFLSNGSTVIFNGTGTQHFALPGITYGNLIFRNSGTKIVYVPVTVNTKLTIEAGATLEAGSNTITLNGDWQNDGTFTPQSSTVLWNGNNKTISGVTTFNKVTVGGKYNVISNVTFNDLFHVTASGVITAPSGSVNVVKGDFTNSGDMYLLGETIFTGTQLQTLSLLNAVRTVAVTITFNGSVSPVLHSTSAPQFAILNVNNTGGVNPSVGWTILSQLNVGAGASFNGGVYTQNLMGNLTNNGVITTSGTFNFIPTTPVNINMGTGFTSTGTVVFGSTGAITLAGTPVAFNNVTVSNTNAAGITPSSDWIMNNNFTVNPGATFYAGARTYTVKGHIKNTGTINSATSLFTLTGTGTQEITSGSALNSITVNKATGVTNLLTNLTMGGQLTFTKGVIGTGNNKLIQTAGATVTGAAQGTGWVNGKLQKNVATGATSRTFETGDASNYTPVTAAFASVTTAGDLVASATPAEHPAINSSDINGNRSVNRYFTLTNNGIAYTTVDVTANFVAGDLDAGVTTSALEVQTYNGSSWSNVTSTNKNAINIKATGLTTLGDIAIGEICNKGTGITYGTTTFCTNSGTASPVITGTTGGIFNADAGITINPSTGVVDFTGTPVGTYKVFYTIPAGGQCREYRTTATIQVGTAGTWTGVADNSWNNPGNWSCGGVPDPSADIHIPAGLPNYPVVTGAQTMNNITVDAGGILTLTSGTLTITGTIASANGINAANGTIKMAGTASQTIPMQTFVNNAVKNLVLANTSTSGVILGGAMDVYNLVSYDGSDIRFTTNDSLTIKSNAAGTGSVGNTTGNYLYGKVTVERYIPSHKAWYFLSIPTNTTQTIKQAWQENSNGAASNPVTGYGIQISAGAQTGWAAAGFDANAASAYMKTYVQATDAWTAVTATNGGTIKNNIGYMTFIKGDRSVTGTMPSTSTTLRTKGELFSGDQPPIPVAANKFGTAGNPYASDIDLREVSTTGLKEFFYLWDPFLGGVAGYGGYQALSYDGADYRITPGGGSYGPGGTVCNYVASGNAFFVQAKDTIGSLIFKENVKSVQGPHSRLNGTPLPGIRVTLNTVTSDTTSYITDGVLANFGDSYSNVADEKDAIKTPNAAENLSLKTSNKLLVVERRHTIVQNDTLNLNMSGMKQLRYSFDITASDLEANVLKGFLVDKFLGTTTPLNMDGTTKVDFTVTSAAASYVADRFKIVFNRISVLPVTFTSIAANRNNDKSNTVTWKVANETNMEKYEVERSSDGSRFNSIGSVTATGTTSYTKIDLAPLSGDNYYRIKAYSIGGHTQYSSIVKVSAVKQAAAISVYPNPVVNKTAQLQFTNQEKGTYNIEISNKLGQLIYTGSAVVPGNSFSRSVSLGERTPAGIYQLKVISESGVVTTMQIVVE